MSVHSDMLPDPVLLTPRGSNIIAGDDVSFAWEPVEGARNYRLQIATDTGFQDLWFDEDLGSRTDIHFSNVFPMDGQTFFWRIIAQGVLPDSPGETIESFVAATAEEAVQTGRAPGADPKDKGPAPGLIRESAIVAGGEIAHTPALADAEYVEGVERDEIETGQILGLAGGILAVLVMAIIVLFQWTSVRKTATQSQAANTATWQTLQDSRINAQRLLSNYEAVQGQQGVYRIPIDRAMELMVQESQSNSAGQYSEELPLK